MLFHTRPVHILSPSSHPELCIASALRSEYIHLSLPLTMTMTNDIFYFGYGSNLWLDQMKKRCPESEYVGIGLMEGWYARRLSRNWHTDNPIGNGSLTGEDMPISSRPRAMSSTDSSSNSALRTGHRSTSTKAVSMSGNFTPSRCYPKGRTM